MKKALLWGVALFAFFVLTGCPKESDPPKPFTLTVTGLPSPGTGKLWGASLLIEPNLGQDDSIAIGFTDNNVLFKFYLPKPGGFPPYDTNKPFRKDGTYVVALAKTTMEDPFNPEAIYFYCNGTLSAKKLVSLPTDTPLAWTDFIEKP